MTICDYTAFDVYVGKWVLDITYLRGQNRRQRTRYNVYWHGGTCFVDIRPPEGGSVACLTDAGEGVNFATWSKGVCRWSGSGKMHIAGLVGLSSHFSFWMPGLLLARDSVPLADAAFVGSRRRYEAIRAPHDGKRFVGLLEDGLLTGLKYHVGKICYVRAECEFQRPVKLGTER